jgi:glycosyltransferase A (GT-A) superfamily protein (DUF2064 family)
MAKTPRVGETKTRLIPPLSPAEAAALSACFIQDAAENIAAAGRRRRSTPISPIGRRDPRPSCHCPREQAVPSRRAGLGAIFRCRRGPACGRLLRGFLINSDSPTLPADILVDAMRAICAPGDRVVLGPAEDGGYYLIGLKETHPRLFEDIAWSTPFVFAQTVERASEIGLPTVVLPRWYDVDDLASLRRLNAELHEAADGQARHTAAFLHRRFDDSGEWLPEWSRRGLTSTAP